MTKLVSTFITLTAALAASAPSAESCGDQLVTTHHRIKVGQKVLRYTARAGLLPIRHNETGEVHGHMFLIAYLLDRLPDEPARPLMRCSRFDGQECLLKQ
jgi:carboxypeptidase C (cathepsin A)